MDLARHIAWLWHALHQHQHQCIVSIKRGTFLSPLADVDKRWSQRKDPSSHTDDRRSQRTNFCHHRPKSDSESPLNCDATFFIPASSTRETLELFLRVSPHKPAFTPSASQGEVRSTKTNRLRVLDVRHGQGKLSRPRQHPVGHFHRCSTSSFSTSPHGVSRWIPWHELYHMVRVNSGTLRARKGEWASI